MSIQKLNIYFIYSTLCTTLNTVVNTVHMYNLDGIALRNDKLHTGKKRKTAPLKDLSAI